MSHLEEFIKDFYTKIGIVNPQQLHFQEVVYRLGIKFITGQILAKPFL